ncbi:MAG: excisionase family DNA-binding protein [Planctomycetota bacterium]
MSTQAQKDYLSCSEAARLMGVSRSTVQRYCELGELRTHKTVGGHRRLDAADVARWLSGQKSKKRHRRKTAEKDLNSAQVADALLHGKLKRLEPLVSQVLLQQKSSAWLFDHYLAPAMWEIGARWSKGTIQYSDERRATFNLKLVLRSLSRTVQPSVPSINAIGGTMEGDHAELGSLAVEMVLQESGMQAYHVGSGLPAQTIVQIAKQMLASLIWVSFCHVQDPKLALQQNRLMHEEMDRTWPVDQRPKLAIGGNALSLSLLKELQYDFYGPSMEAFRAFVSEF